MRAGGSRPRRSAPRRAAVAPRVPLRRDGKPADGRRAHRSLRHRGSIYVSRLRPGAPAAAARARARRRLRPGRADDRAGGRRLRRARDRPARAGGRPLPPDPARGPRPGRGAASTPSSPPTRCTTSATSGRRSTGSSRSCGPAGRSSSTSTAGISRTRRRSTGSTTSAARSRRRGRARRLRRSRQLREEWEAEHVGLHGFEALRAEVDARFEERAFVRTPFLHRLLGGVATEVLEQALIDAGAIQALGFRYAGVARVTGRVTRCITRIGDGTTPESRLSLGEIDPIGRRAALLLTSTAEGLPRCRRLHQQATTNAQRLTSSEAEASGATGRAAGFPLSRPARPRVCADGALHRLAQGARAAAPTASSTTSRLPASSR